MPLLLESVLALKTLKFWSAISKVKMSQVHIEKHLHSLAFAIHHPLKGLNFVGMICFGTTKRWPWLLSRGVRLIGVLFTVFY